MSVSQVATGSVKGAMSGVWGIVVKYVLPLGFVIVGLSTYNVFNVGAIIDSNVGGIAQVAPFWKTGYGGLLASALFLSIGVTLVMADGSGLGGAIKTSIGGLLTGMGLGQLFDAAKALGVA